MKLFLTNLRLGRAHEPSTAPRDDRQNGGSDDTLGRGMDVALTLLVFLGIGALIDRGLGLFPVFTITLVVFAAIGTFIRMKYVYDATMERLEADRAAQRHGVTRAPAAARVEDVA